MCHKRSTSARRKGVGGCRRFHRAPHVKLWEHQRPPRACRSAAACGVTITSPVNQLHPGVKEAPTSKGRGTGQGTLQAAREAGRVRGKERLQMTPSSPASVPGLSSPTRVEPEFPSRMRGAFRLELNNAFHVPGLFYLSLCKPGFWSGGWRQPMEI